jgi:hypothetical protein
VKPTLSIRSLGFTFCRAFKVFLARITRPIIEARHHFEEINMPKNVEVDTADEQPVSAKRQFAATAAAVVVTVAIGVAASTFANKVAERVHDKIAPPKTEDE